jgi:hypothetical protein
MSVNSASSGASSHPTSAPAAAAMDRSREVASVGSVLSEALLNGLFQVLPGTPAEAAGGVHDDGRLDGLADDATTAHVGFLSGASDSISCGRRQPVMAMSSMTA